MFQNGFQSVNSTVGNAINYLTRYSTPAGFSEHTFEEFGPLFELNDRISNELARGLTEEDTATYELDPPRVIVVGLTSAGKSSLLERVIGHKIFPVRDNVCTRRPFRCQIKKSKSTTDKSELRFLNSSTNKQTFELPEDIDAVRSAIEEEQQSSNNENVVFSSNEITAEIKSPENQTFTFTDLPGIFLVSETKIGGDYAESRKKNEQLKEQTINIIKKYIGQKNTIVLVVVSATDWMHGMNNDNLIGYLAEWLEELRKQEKRDIPVYGVITKLDTQTAGLTENSPIKKVLMGHLPKNHILNGLRARRWIPVVSSPQVLDAGVGEKAAKMEQDAIHEALRSGIPAQVLGKLPVGRACLIRELKAALLHSISLSYAGIRGRVDQFVCDIDDRLKLMPPPAQPNEKRRIFEAGLKTLETTLNDLIGANGKHMLPVKGKRSLRMQLLVDAAKQFDVDLQEANLRGDVVNEVEQIVNQAALEQGGSFDSDVTFVCLSQKIIQRFSQPCLTLVSTASSIISTALKEATKQAFGNYKGLEQKVVETLGIQSTVILNSELGFGHTGTRTRTPSSQGVPAGLQVAEDGLPRRLVSFLTHSAAEKVMGLLDAFSTMSSCHPMWRNFDVLYQDVLLKGGNNKEQTSAENTLQDMLNLKDLAKRAALEGETAISHYEKETGEKLPTATKNKIAKHFARVEVMGYIVRMSLVSSVFPLVLRDVRDGLFRGVSFGGHQYGCSVSSLLRTRLVFDAQMERVIMQLLDPSPADMAMRAELVGKRDSLLTLKKEFNECSSNLQRLVTLFDSDQSSP